MIKQRITPMALAATALGLVIWILRAGQALADTGAAGDGTEPKVWAVVAGGLVPIGGYALNLLWPNAAEQVKALVHVLLAAVAGGLAQAIEIGGVGFNSTTLEYVVVAIVSALAAHAALYKPAGVNAAIQAVRPAHRRRHR